MRRSFRGSLFDFNFTTWDGVKQDRQAQQSGGQILTFAQAAGLTAALTCVASAVVAESYKHSQSNWLVLTELQSLTSMHKLYESSETVPMVQGTEQSFVPTSQMQAEQADLFIPVAYTANADAGQGGQIQLLVADTVSIGTGTNHVSVAQAEGGDYGNASAATYYSLQSTGAGSDRGGESVISPASYQPTSHGDYVKELPQYNGADYARPAHDALLYNREEQAQTLRSVNEPEDRSDSDVITQLPYANEIDSEEQLSEAPGSFAELDGLNFEVSNQLASSDFNEASIETYFDASHLLDVDADAHFSNLDCWYHCNSDYFLKINDPSLDADEPYQQQFEMELISAIDEADDLSEVLDIEQSMQQLVVDTEQSSELEVVADIVNDPVTLVIEQLQVEDIDKVSEPQWISLFDEVALDEGTEQFIELNRLDVYAHEDLQTQSYHPDMHDGIVESDSVIETDLEDWSLDHGFADSSIADNMVTIQPMVSADGGDVF